jgi:hemolysin III
VLADALAHTVGVVLAFVGIGALISKAQNLTGAHAASVWIYCIGLITSFGVSATYNMWPMCRGKRCGAVTMKMVLRRLDHCAIYFFIAATYSPFLLGTVQSVSTTVLLLGIWTLATIGVTLKLVAPGRFDRVSIVLYLAMGWSGVLAYESVFSQLTLLSLSFIITGGILYSAGVVFHLWDQLRFQNAIWHAFVVAAAAFQYAAVFSSVLAATA